MLDWRAYVRERLRLPDLRPEREAEVVEEIAQQLEDAYRSALERGASAREAEAAGQREVQDWQALAREITQSDAHNRREIVRHVLDRLESAGSAAAGSPGTADSGRLGAAAGAPDTPRRRAGGVFVRVLSQFAADLLHAIRLLFKNPGFTAAVLLTLALGIGANAAVFTILNAVLLRPLPYAEPERLVRIWESNPQRGWPQFATSQPNYLDWRDQSVSFERLAASGPISLTLAEHGEAERIRGLAITHEFLPMLGVRPVLGRAFRADEDVPGQAERLVLMTRGLWKRRFGGDPAIIGRTISLNDAPYTVIGVVPEFYWATYEVFVPLRPDPAQQRGDHRLSTYGKLKPGVGLRQAQAEMTGIAQRLARQYPDSNGGWTVTLETFYDWVVPRESRRTLYVLLGAVALVLLIACANVASLLLARAAGRRREIAIRAALGASRARLVRQLLAESLLVAVLGGALGLLLAQWGLDALGVAGGTAVPRADEISLDYRVLLFTLLVSVFTGILFGLAPALHATRVDFHGMLKEGTLGGASRQRARSVLVVSEVALSLVLLIGVGLLLRSMGALLDVHPGYDTRNLLTASISLPDGRYPSAKEFLAFHNRLLERLRASPGVDSTTAASGLPMDGSGTSMEVYLDGAPVQANSPRTSADWRLVSRGYFHTMRIPIRRGRDLSAQDVSETGELRGVVISEAMARQCWPGQDPIGRSFRAWNANNSPVTVVGVVGDVRLYSLDLEPGPVVYLNFAAGVWNPLKVVVRTAGDPMDFAALLRDQVRGLDPGVPLAQVQTMEELIEQTTAPRRFTMTLLSIFAGVALLLASVGLFGLMAYHVAQHTRDIGVRMALGARQRDILRLILGRAMLLTSFGIAAGIAGALALTRMMSSMLFGVGARDPLTLTATALLLGTVALAACWIPARRAARVDPMAALRYE